MPEEDTDQLLKVEEECKYATRYHFQVLGRATGLTQVPEDTIIPGQRLNDTRAGSPALAANRLSYIQSFEFNDLGICDPLGSRTDFRFCQGKGDLLRAPVKKIQDFVSSSTRQALLVTFSFSRFLTGSTFLGCSCSKSKQVVILGGAGCLSYPGNQSGDRISGGGTKSEGSIGSCEFPAICSTIPIYQNCLNVETGYFGWIEYTTESLITVREVSGSTVVLFSHNINADFIGVCAYGPGGSVDCRGGTNRISASANILTGCTTPGQIGASHSAGGGISWSKFTLPGNWESSLDEDGNYLGIDTVNFISCP
jgi:hypothetical protein